MYDWENIFVLKWHTTYTFVIFEKIVKIKLGKPKLKCLLQTSCGRLIYEVVFPREECSVSRRTQLPLAEIFPLDQPYRLIFSRSGRSKLGPAWNVNNKLSFRALHKNYVHTLNIRKSVFFLLLDCFLNFLFFQYSEFSI